MKRIISITVALSLLVSSIPVGFASKTNVTPNQVEYNNSLPFTKSNVTANEKVTNSKSKIQLNVLEIKNSGTTKGISIQSTDPGDGAIRITETSRWTTGITYDGMSKQSASLSNLFTVSFTAAGYILTKGINIVKDVVATVFQIQWSEVVVSAPGTIKSSHSYSYTSKLGQVYQAGSWKTKVDIEKRYTYGHGYASFKCKDGLTRSGTYDYLSTPVATELRSNYNNHSWIQTKVTQVIQTGSYPYIDAWTHSYVAF